MSRDQEKGTQPARWKLNYLPTTPFNSSTKKKSSILRLTGKCTSNLKVGNTG